MARVLEPTATPCTRKPNHITFGFGLTIRKAQALEIQSLVSDYSIL